MKKVYVRRAASSGESASAAVLALGLGALMAGISFYVTRVFLARDVLRISPESAPTSGEDGEGTESP